MKVCIIDSRVVESNTFFTSVQSGVTAILLDYEKDTFVSLLAKIDHTKQVESIAYVAHGTFDPTYSFFKDSSFDMNVKESWNPFFEFLRGINGLQYFDFLGCSLASDDSWKQVFRWTEETGIHVRASTDETGNVASGGNWILEDGSVDAKAMYFTNLDSFDGLLYVGTHTVIIKNNALWASGSNMNGQLGINSNTNVNVFTQMKNSDGTDLTFSSYRPTQIAYGNKHTIVLMSNNTLWACGSNLNGQLGINSYDDTNVLIQMKDITGANITFSTYWPTQITCGNSHTVILMSNNTLWACGSVSSGQLGINSYDDTNVLTQMKNSDGIDLTFSTYWPTQISCGDNHTVVLMSNNTLWACGRNNFGQISINSTSDTPVLTQMTNSDGTDLTFSTYWPTQIACGGLYTVVLMSDNTIWSCGYNTNGQLGINSTSNALRLTQMKDITGANITFSTYWPTRISCGNNHTIVLMSDNTIWVCGGNNYGQLGINTSGTTAKKTILTQMKNSDNSSLTFSTYYPIQITTGSSHTCVLMSDNTIWACGWNSAGQLGIGNNTQQLTLTYSVSDVYRIRNPFIIPTITFNNITKTAGDAAFSLTATSNSDGGFDYSSSNTSVVQIITSNGTLVVITGQGSSTITATQAIYGNYLAGSATATLTVNAAPTIGTFTVPTKTVGNAAFSLTAPSSNSSGAFTYSSSNTSVATISGSTVTIVGQGSSTITASQAASGYYLAGSATATLTVNAAASSSGDPYITTFSGLTYKLPNILRTYRLVEYPIANDTLYINATVSELSPQEKQDIKDTFQSDIIANGFFYESFFIGTKSSYAILDRQLNIIKSQNLSNYSLTIQDEYLPYECPIQGETTYQAKIIQIDDITIELRKYSNPQILNGIEVSLSNPSKAKGILSNNINPKHFAIKKIDNTTSIHVSSVTPYNRDVKELWISKMLEF